MFRKWQVYMGANDYVNMTEGMDSSMLVTLGQRRRRRTLTLMVLVMALFVGCGLITANPAAFQWLSRVAPPVAQFLLPRAGSREESGIRLDIAEVTREGDTLRIHLTMEDIQGDRLEGGCYCEWWEYRQERSAATGSRSCQFDQETGLLHLYLSCKPSEDMPNFDWERWVTVTIYNLHTPQELIEETWTIQVSPITEE